MISTVSYEEQKIKIRAELEKEFAKENKLDSIFLDLVTEKIMAEGFNKEFYRGTGLSDSSFSVSSINLDFKSKRKALLKGFGITFFSIFQIVKPRRRVESSIPLGLIYAIPSQHYAGPHQRKKLEIFLDTTLIETGTKPPRQYLLQSGTFGKFEINGKIEVVTHIGAKILSSWAPSKSKALFDIVGRFFAWIRISKLHPSFLLAGSEYIVDVLAIEIMKPQQELVLITTQSQLLSPPLIFKSEIKASRIMYWYSDNSIQITAKESIPRDYSYLYQRDIKTHFVWTNSWARILSKFNKASLIIPFGPVLFEPLEQKKISRMASNNSKNILIFDVTPKKSADPMSYYSEKIMTSFISDIIEVVLDVCPSATLRLKPKREYSRSDSIGYRNYLASKSGFIKQLKSDSEIQREILNSDLVICIPFTSPGLVAAALGIPTIYYSASSDFDLYHESIEVISGKASLKEFLCQEISDRG